MTLDIAKLCWVLFGRIKLQDFTSPNRRNLTYFFTVIFVIVHSSKNSHSKHACTQAM